MEVSGQLHAPAALSPGKEPRHPFDWRLDGRQSRFGHGGEEKKKSFHCPRWELNPGRSARTLISILTELPRLGGL
jgi:hypothetical protein